MKIRHALVIPLFLAFAADAAGQEPATSPPSEAEPTPHVYKTAGDAELRLYVFDPGDEPGGRHPAILVFHGGGWSMGEASWSFDRARHYADLGLVAIAVQYRLSDQQTVTPLDAMADARDAFRWVRAHAGEIGVDPARVAGHGSSAGGHLLASAALFGNEAPDGEPSSRPDLMVLFSPAVALDGDGWFERLLLGRATAASASPDHHVRPGMPPAIILQGETDTVTPAAGARRFCDRMKEADNSCRIVVFPDVGHLFTPSSEPDDGWPDPDPEVASRAIAEADDFLREHGYVPARDVPGAPPGESPGPASAGSRAPRPSHL